MTSNDIASGNFRNETSKSMEITIPVEVSATIRLWLEPGEELTAKMINNAIDEFAAVAANDDFHHPKLSNNISLCVVGIHEDDRLEYYNAESSGEIVPPDGVQFMR